MENLESLSDRLLKEAYDKSKELALDKEFIKQLEKEIKRRDL